LADQPTSLRGYTDLFAADYAAFGGVEGFGNLVDAILEVNPELLWPMSLRTYARMRHEPQIAAILKVYFLAIQRAPWTVDGAGCRDEVTAFVADELGLPVKGADDTPSGARRRNFTFDEHLRLSLLDLVYGHMFFEQAYVETGGRWRLLGVQERMPHTVYEVKLNTDGTLAGIVQEAPVGGRQPAPITTADHRLVYYVNEREGSNFFGRSILRPSFAPWLIKDQVLRVHGTSIRRFGMGLPYAECPPSYTPAQIAEVQRMVAGMKATEHMGAALPAGVTLKLAGLTGNVPDAVAFINYLDRQMTRSTLTSLLDMATAERGARSLGETIMDLMVYAQTAVAEAHAETATKQLVVPLVDANWGEDEPAPQVSVEDVGADIQATAQDINWLLGSGALTHDPELEGYLRGRYSIPDIDPAYLPQPGAAADTTTPVSGGQADA
jgi:hypothetical protein